MSEQLTEMTFAWRSGPGSDTRMTSKLWGRIEATRSASS